MGIHPNPSELVETNPDSNLTAKDVWTGTKPVQADFGVEQCALDGDNSFQFLAVEDEQHVLLRYVEPFVLSFSHRCSTIDTAFNQHRPLALTPDDFFLPLVQAAARFIDDALEKKRPILGLKLGREGRTT